MDLGLDLGQVDLSTIGNFEHNTIENKFEFRATIGLDFFFNDDAIKKMGEDLAKYPELKPIIITESPYVQGLKEKMGLKESDKVISELTLAGTLKKLPEEMAANIVLADVKMKWDPIMDSYISEGPIALASVGKDEVFAEVKGILQLEKKRSGDELYLYIELDDDTWYYFNYGRTLMQAYSSNAEFNEVIIETKEDARESKGEKGQDAYTYMLASKRKKDNFLDDIGYKR